MTYSTAAPPTFHSSEQSTPTAPVKRSRLGRAALIIGSVALVGSVIPILNYGTGLVAVAGVVLALIARHQRRGDGSPGLLLSVIALVLSVALAVLYTTVGARVLSTLEPSAPVAAPPVSVAVGTEVTYELTGDGGPVSFDYTGHDDQGEYVSNGFTIPLPFRESIELPSNLAPAADLVFNATGSADSSTLTCRILIGGVIVEEQTGTGSSAVVSCGATL